MASEDEKVLTRAPLSYWGGLLVVSFGMAWLFANHILLFVGIAVLILFSGYFVFGLFSRNQRRFFTSFFVVAAMLLGGVLGALWPAFQ